LFPERLIDVSINKRASRVVDVSESGLFGTQTATVGQVRPKYLTRRDHGWVEQVLDAVTASVGQPRCEVAARLREGPSFGEHWRAHRALCYLLLRLHGFEVSAPIKPQRLRAALFNAAAAAQGSPDRQTIVRDVARQLSVTAEQIEHGLYADLPDARVLKASKEALDPIALVERYNLALAQSLLWRAETLKIRLSGQVKAALRLARLRGLLCLAERDPVSAEAVLRLSGPLALFHHTTKYGRAMAAWLPVLTGGPRWSLEATCIVSRRRLVWCASFRDPIGTTHAPPQRFDSKLEERLFRDLKHVVPRWQVLREADPVQLGKRIVCPDFTLVDPDKGRRIPVEVVGFWTPEYLRDKLQTLRRLPADQRWIVCADNSLADKADGDAWPTRDLFWFRCRIDAEALVAFIERVW